MHTNTSTGTSVGHLTARRGTRASLLALALCAALALAGCQRHVLIDLLNSSGQGVSVSALSFGKEKSYKIRNEARKSLLVSGPLIIETSGKVQRYSVPAIPDQLIRSKINGRVISLGLRPDGKLYLLSPKEKIPTIPMNPQPEPFPISPESQDE